MVTVSKLEHPLHNCSSILAMPLGMFMVLRLVQFKKAFEPISVNDLEKENSVIFLQFQNAP